MEDCEDVPAPAIDAMAVMAEKIIKYSADINLMTSVTRLKIDQRDWHGAIDFLMDIRDLDAEIKAIYEMQELLKNKGG